MSGRDFLDAMLRGELPLPPICHLVDFTSDRIDIGRVEMALKPRESQYNRIVSVHGGIIATVLNSVMGCAVHAKLPVGRAYTKLDGRTREAALMRDTRSRLIAHVGGSPPPLN